MPGRLRPALVLVLPDQFQKGSEEPLRLCGADAGDREPLFYGLRTEAGQGFQCFVRENGKCREVALFLRETQAESSHFFEEGGVKSHFTEDHGCFA